MKRSDYVQEILDKLNEIFKEAKTIEQKSDLIMAFTYRMALVLCMMNEVEPEDLTPELITQIMKRIYDVKVD